MECVHPFSSVLSMFLFPLGSCIGRLREINALLDRFIVVCIVVFSFLCTTILTDIVYGIKDKRIGIGISVEGWGGVSS